jgi:hypothetical protein
MEVLIYCSNFNMLLMGKTSVNGGIFSALFDYRGTMILVGTWFCVAPWLPMARKYIHAPGSEQIGDVSGGSLKSCSLRGTTVRVKSAKIKGLYVSKTRVGPHSSGETRSFGPFQSGASLLLTPSKRVKGLGKLEFRDGTSAASHNIPHNSTRLSMRGMKNTIQIIKTYLMIGIQW